LATTFSIAPVSHVRLLLGATVAAACLAGAATASAQPQSEILAVAPRSPEIEGALVVTAAPDRDQPQWLRPRSEPFLPPGLREPAAAADEDPAAC
jgi:hypothetical protein